MSSISKHFIDFWTIQHSEQAIYKTKGYLKPSAWQNISRIWWRTCPYEWPYTSSCQVSLTLMRLTNTDIPLVSPCSNTALAFFSWGGAIFSIFHRGIRLLSGMIDLSEELIYRALVKSWRSGDGIYDAILHTTTGWGLLWRNVSTENMEGQWPSERKYHCW